MIERKVAMEMPEKTAIKKNKRKISAAAVAAAAFAIVWILLEVALFISSIPSGEEMPGVDHSVYETVSGVYTIKTAGSLRYSAEMGRIDNLSFVAQAVSPEEYTPDVLTVKVRAYDPSNSDSLLTYKTQKFAIGKDSSERTVVKLDIPAEAGEVILEFSHKSCNYRVGEITFNYKDGASFNYLRTAIVLAVIGVLYLCHHFKLWQVYFDPKKHSAAGLALCVLCVIIAILLAYVLGSAKLTEEYPLKWEPRYFDPYEQQFDALMKGQLHLDVEPSEELLALENPYDYASRDGVDYLWDRAFYDGKYYSYFGMAPLFTVYFPFYFVTGSLPEDSTVTGIFAVMTALFFSLAAVKWASMYTKKLPIPVLVIGTVSALFSSQVFLVMRGRTKFYYIATIAGMAFLSLFLWLLLCGISGSVRFAPKEEKENRQWPRLVLYVLAGIAYGLLFMSRVNIALLAAFAVLPMLWFRILTDGSGKVRFRPVGRIISELFALGVPVVCFVAVQLYLNYARFGSLFEFGTTYQLTVSDISLNKLRISDLPAAIFHYFLQPVSLNSDYPFVSLFYTKLESYGHYVYVDTGMGLLSIPLMWMLFGSVLVFANKKRPLAHKVTLGSIIFGMIAVALFDFCLGGVIFRYTCDLTLMGAFAAMAVAFSISEDVDGDGDDLICRRIGYLTAAIFALSLLTSLSLAMSLNNNLTAYDPSAYVTFRDLFMLFQ